MSKFSGGQDVVIQLGDESPSAPGNPDMRTLSGLRAHWPP